MYFRMQNTSSSMMKLTYWTGNRFEADINASKAPEEFKKAAIYAPKRTCRPSAAHAMVRPGADIAPGVTLIPAPGHSPSHTAIRFSSDNAELIHMLTLAHRSDSGLQHPEWSVISISMPSRPSQPESGS